MDDYIERLIEMLRAVHDWVERRPAGEHRIEVAEVATLLGGGQYVDPYDTDPDKATAKHYQEEQLSLFNDLIEERLINARVYTVEEPPPPHFTFAMVRGLTPQGLEAIR